MSETEKRRKARELEAQVHAVLGIADGFRENADLTYTGWHVAHLLEEVVVSMRDKAGQS